MPQKKGLCARYGAKRERIHVAPSFPDVNLRSHAGRVEAARAWRLPWARPDHGLPAVGSPKRTLVLQEPLAWLSCHAAGYL
jgi:hypothetical protein